MIHINLKKKCFSLKNPSDKSVHDNYIKYEYVQDGSETWTPVLVVWASPGQRVVLARDPSRSPWPARISVDRAKKSMTGIWRLTDIKACFTDALKQFVRPIVTQVSWFFTFVFLFFLDRPTRSPPPPRPHKQRANDLEKIDRQASVLKCWLHPCQRSL